MHAKKLAKVMTMNSTKKQSGFTMVETLVSSFVLAIGLLGAASTQLNGLKVTQETFNRSKAVYIASDIIDRMRANPAGMLSGDYNSIDTTSTAPTATVCTSSTTATTLSCTASELAAADNIEWRAFVAELPNGKGSVTYDATNETYKVSVIWQERHFASSAGETLSDTTSTSEDYGKYEVTVAFDS